MSSTLWNALKWYIGISDMLVVGALLVRLLAIVVRFRVQRLQESLERLEPVFPQDVIGDQFQALPNFALAVAPRVEDQVAGDGHAVLPVARLQDGEGLGRALLEDFYPYEAGAVALLALARVVRVADDRGLDAVSGLAGLPLRALPDDGSAQDGLAEPEVSGFALLAALPRALGAVVHESLQLKG